MKNILTTALLIVTHVALSQRTEITFNVIFKDKNIGKIIATELRNDTKTTYDVKSETNAHVLMFSVHVESEMKIEKGKEVMLEGTAYRHANRGAEDVHATTKRLSAKKYERQRNGKTTTYTEGEINFCVAELFFKEPTGVTKIYSNMYAEMLSLKSLGDGRYQMTTPDKKNSIYTYQNGKLISVESDTPAGKVISKRA